MKYCKPHLVFLVFLAQPPPQSFSIFPVPPPSYSLRTNTALNNTGKKREGEKKGVRGEKGGVNLYSEPCFFPFGLPADSASV